MKSIITLCLLVIGAFGTALAQQTVSSGADSGPGTLREAITLVPNNGTITFQITVPTVDLISELVIDKNVTISGTFGLSTTIDAANNSRIFNIGAGYVVLLNNLTLENGEEIDGGAIMNSSNLTLNDCEINNCIANGTPGSGGGIFNDVGGVLTVNNSSFTGNTAVRAGGAIEDNSGMGLGIILNNVTLDNNSAMSSPGNGGGLHITGAGNSSISNSTVINNTASAEGGGLWNGTGTMTVSSTSVNDNTAVGNGAAEGGGGLFNAGGNLVLEGSIVNDNVTTGPSTSGGGILNDMGILTVNNTTIDGNSAIRAGGGIEDNSASGNMMTLNNVTITNNEASASPGNGGGLHITGPGNSIISNSTVTGNSAAAEGGGLWNGSGLMNVVSSDISSNSVTGNGADQGGGGLFNAGGTLVVDSSTINSNLTTGTSTSGGGILNDLGELTVTNSTLDGNTSIRAGGGIEDNSASGSQLTLGSVIFSNNMTGATPGNGGGLHITGPGNSIIAGCTFTMNTAASEGGGLWNGSGSMIITNGDISNNVATGVDADNGGAGVFNNGGTLLISEGTMIRDNMSTGTAGSGGGLLSTAGLVTIDSTTFSGNGANRAGGAIEIIDGDLIFTSSSMMDNDVNGSAGTAAPGNGGGLHVSGMSGTITLENSSFTGNEAAREGGALWNQSGTTMTVLNSTVDGNSSFGATSTNGGAGIFNSGGILSVTGSTISNNIDDGASAAGAGIHNKANGVVTVMTSTISGNTSSTGGGIYTNGTSLTINAATIAFNDASVNGGGIQSMTGAQLKNTIVSDNTSALDTDLSGSSYVSLGYNAFGSDINALLTPATSDLNDIDPMLNTLSIGTGSTATHSLQVSSPAYNAGDPADMFDDQNGNPVFGTSRDIGSDEAQTILGTDELIVNSEINIVVYPNPTSAMASIAIPDEFGTDIEIGIYSMVTGALLKNVTSTSGLVSIDLGTYPSGMYVLKMQSEKYINNAFINKL